MKFIFQRESVLAVPKIVFLVLLISLFFLVCSCHEEKESSDNSGNEQNCDASYPFCNIPIPEGHGRFWGKTILAENQDYGIEARPLEGANPCCYKPDPYPGTSFCADENGSMSDRNGYYYIDVPYNTYSSISETLSDDETNNIFPGLHDPCAVIGAYTWENYIFTLLIHDRIRIDIYYQLICCETEGC
jgi:hypothetical protein